ncbi:MAG: hypothetical protein WBO70_02100, partial [Erysipelotrichaceae bacterium]
MIKCPCYSEINTFIKEIKAIMFPDHFSCSLDSLEQTKARLFTQINILLDDDIARTKTNLFFEKVDDIARKLRADSEFAHLSDPASNGIDEVIICYPGFYAVL